MKNILRIIDGNKSTGIINSVSYTNHIIESPPLCSYYDYVDSVPEGFNSLNIYLKESTENSFGCTVEPRVNTLVTVDSLVKPVGEPFIFSIENNLELFFIVKGVEVCIKSNTKLLLPEGSYSVKLNLSNPKNIPYCTDELLLKVVANE